MNYIEEKVEDFYSEFRNIQWVKNEMSGNNYKTIGDFLRTTLTEVDRRARENALFIVQREIDSTDSGEVLSYLERIKERLTPKEEITNNQQEV